MKKSTLSPQQLLSFYQAVEKLKSTLRHSWLSNGTRQESVAEHTWMMSLLAMTILPHLQIKLDQLKVLQMITLHDLAESITQDAPVWVGMKNPTDKANREKNAMKTILSHLDPSTYNQLLSIWEEYESRTSPEAKFVKVLDTLDVISQHNAAPITTWDDNDYLWQLSPIQNKFFDFDAKVCQVKQVIDKWSINKVKAANNLSKLDQVELKKRQNNT